MIRMMVRTVLFAILALGVLSFVGCRHELMDTWGFHHVERHVNAIDDDLHDLHMDLDEIIFGVDNYKDYLNEINW